MAVGVAMCGGGLSPRVRGNPDVSARARVHRGSIPACAGEPGIRGELHPLSAVYPRVCGGTAAAPSYWLMIRGLSPRVRGNPCNWVSVVHVDGSIPACAGEPRLAGGTKHVGGVYPRVCGGTLAPNAQSTINLGLSPRVRGNLGTSGRGLRRIGSIPACAGEPTYLDIITDRE